MSIFNSHPQLPKTIAMMAAADPYGKAVASAEPSAEIVSIQWQ